MTYIKETKKRSLIKTISWRMVAIFNSWIILTLVVDGSNFMLAFLMNITGFIVFYFFERLWTKIKYGRKILDK